MLRDIDWIKSQARAREPLNLHAVERSRPALLKEVFSGTSPTGWYRTLLRAGVNPDQIVHEHSEEVHCPCCDYSGAVLGTHLKTKHGMERQDCLDEFGPEFQVSSERFRADKFLSLPIFGIKHWEQLWSKYYVIDWILRMKESGHALNCHNINQHGQSLIYAGIKYFGSWDAALVAAGLKPDDERAIPVFRYWTGESVIEELREFAMRKKSNWRLEMPMDLRCAIVRIFEKPEIAAKAAGLKHEDISQRAIFSSPKVSRLVDAIRNLEGLRGKNRVEKLRAIYHRDENSRRIVENCYGSLQKLALREGIDLKVVSPKAYRDESDVIHDLDLIEQSGKPINVQTLINGHKRLYNVIRETGWCENRLSRAKT